MHEDNFPAVLMLFHNCYPTIPLKYPVVVVDDHYPQAGQANGGIGVDNSQQPATQNA